ncbi:DUF6513 domain-containing protein [Prosthecomicrobium sp. N25]|uniref:DUF6513 domain-containing protein n=1 Tax=Prosthecomicrobium sp. N25 TaxID=3129254 RepID=UPI00307858EF
MSDEPRPDRILLLTGHLARPRLEKTLAEIGGRGPGGATFQWQVADVGVKVAALMTEDIIRRRVKPPEGTTRIVVPGRCRADLAALSAHFGVPVERGPDEIVDLPAFFGRGAREPDLSRHDLRIFAEIVDAPDLDVAGVVAKAKGLVAAGADVVDLGCLPDTPFPHLADCVRALKAEGIAVSVDSADLAELLTGARAGCDFLLSLNEDTLDHARDVPAVPVLVPARPGDLDSLVRAAERMEAWGLPYMADPILDPIHFGFTASIVRYHEFRRRMPAAEMLMGTGNLTELTEADTSGITMTLLGIASELAIRNVLVVQVSPHTRRTIEEHDAARRILFAARHDGALPKGYGGRLATVHDRKPYANTPEGVAANAAAVRDRNYRIEVVEDGVHVYNRDVHVVAREALDAFPHLGVEADGSHAFYLGAELAKAETAFRLGKRYAQDEPIDWGAAWDRKEEDLTRLKAAGHTLATRKKRSEPGAEPAVDPGEDAD